MSFRLHIWIFPKHGKAFHHEKKMFHENGYLFENEKIRLQSVKDGQGPMGAGPGG